jgi:aspartyl-tRNA(Asn)/glutamyl-tRNA(Gln) amidotransferase subunit C
MRMQVDRTLLLQLENLAKLELSEDERENLKVDLERMIQMVGKLEELNLEGVEPLRHMSEGGIGLREDEIANQISNRQALKNAPGKKDVYFTVPKVIKRD